MKRAFFVDVEVGIERFAQELADKNNAEQALFFNAFAEALFRQCKDQFHFELQCHSIREGETGQERAELTEKAKDMCYTLSGEFKATK